MAPKISVVVPTYNRSALLLEALASARGQTRPPDEIIVVDDGSTDDTAEAVARFAPEARYLRQANAGAAAARNRGIEHASGDFIALLDSDDLWMPDRLERQLALLERHRDLDFLFGIEAKFSAAQELGAPDVRDPEVRSMLEATNGPLPQALSLLLRENVVPTSTVLFRAECARKIGPMNTAFVPVEDYDFWLRFAAAGYRFGFVNAPLCRRRLHEGNLVNQWVRMTSSLIAVLTAHQNQPEAADRERIRRRLSGLHYDLGSRLLREKRYDRALHHLREARPRGFARLARRAKLVLAAARAPRAPAQ